MARYPRWEPEELLLLADLYVREGRYPTEESVSRLHDVLVARGRLWTEAAFDPGFRSEDSIGTQLWRLSLLEEDPSGAETKVSLRMREAWRLFSQSPKARARHAALLIESFETLLKKDEVSLTPYGRDRIALHAFVAELRMVLHEMMEQGSQLVEPPALEDLQEAWIYLQEEDVFEEALESILDSRSEEGLAAVGLVEAPRKLKVRGFNRALRRLRELVGRWTWTDLKPVLRWANIILGSLATTITSIDPIKEFKESWEAAAEEAYE